VVALTGGVNSSSNFFCGNARDGEIPAELLGAAYKILRQALREWMCVKYVCIVQRLCVSRIE